MERLKKLVETILCSLKIISKKVDYIEENCCGDTIITWENIEGDQSVVNLSEFNNDAEFITTDDIPPQVFQSDITVSLTDNKNIGKYLNGETIPCEGWTFEEWARDVSIEYLSPSFSTFTISGQSTSVEIGTVLSGNKNFTFSFQYPQNINPVSLSVLDVTNGTTLASGLGITSPQPVDIGTVSKTNPNTNHQWRATAINTQGNTFQSGLFTVGWYLRRFFGATSASVSNSTEARNLPQTVLDNTSNTFILNTGSTLKIFDVLIPTNKSITQVLDLDALNANITANYVLVDGNFTINDIGGTPRSYKKYEMTVEDTYSSNHRHQITIS